jgi:5-methylcytosine-specific restriction enzyme subunit McrC
MRQLTLTEFKATRAVGLSHQEMRALREIAPSISVTPSQDRAGTFDLTPASHVGAIVLPTLRILVKPKIDMHRLMFVLSYSVDPRRWRDVGFDFEEDNTIFEAIVPGFLFQLRMALRRGLLTGYKAEDEASSTIRGRLRFGDQIARRYGRAVPAEISFDDYRADVPLNQVLKAAVLAAKHLYLRSTDVRRQLRRFEVLLGDVSSVQFDARRLPDFEFTRLDAHYRPAVELAKLIIRGSSFRHREGLVEGAAFLIDMNEVFEDFVVVALREILRLGHHEFVQGGRDRPLYLATHQRVRLKPDLAWWRAGRCTFVGDVKYKRLATASPNADLYQLLAYAVATGLPSATLVYAAGETAHAAYEVSLASKALLVRTIDLATDPDDLLRQIAELASEITRDRLLL